MKLNDEHTLLNRFCGNDEYRQQFWNPFYDEHLEIVCATDTHCMIMGDKDLFINEYAPLEHPVTIYNILPVEQHDELFITYDKLTSLFDKIPYTRKTECPECGGYGRVDTKYETKEGQILSIEIECPICNGKGEVIGEEKKDYRYMIRFKDLCFKYKMMLVLAKTMEELRVEKIKVLALRDLKLYVELLPGLKALFMCTCQAEDLIKGDSIKNPDFVVRYPFEP